MNDGRQKDAESLSQFHSLLLHLRDQAEAKIPVINEAITRLYTTRFVSECVILGGVILERAYPPSGPVDAGQVVVSVLRVPGGIGALCTDSESYRIARRTQGELEEMASLSMTAFDRCEPIIKARLLDEVKPLLQQFLEAMDIPDLQ